MARTEITYWAVLGEKRFPTGYHDRLYYAGHSRWQALKAVWTGLRNGMTVTISRHRVRKFEAR